MDRKPTALPCPHGQLAPDELYPLQRVRVASAYRQTTGERGVFVLLEQSHTPTERSFCPLDPYLSLQARPWPLEALSPQTRKHRFGAFA
jgi:hypothetical protein